ncbi:DUF2572 family protein [Caviibacterium pharyngocola]|nr:DUF2572 family protein [Caviibacterium pharyngocola]
MHYRGMITLTLLLLLSSFVLLSLLFFDDVLRLHLGITAQRKSYLAHNLPLQRISYEQKKTICQTLGLDNDNKSERMIFENGEENDRTSDFLWCKRIFLLKSTPKKALYEGEFDLYIDERALPALRAKLEFPASNAATDRNDHFYWFDAEQSEWEINGNINAVVVAQGDLTLSGKGKISGAVITKGVLKKADAVQLVYRKATVSEMWRAFSYWQLAEKSWYDFNPL